MYSLWQHNLKATKILLPLCTTLHPTIPLSSIQDAEHVCWPSQGHCVTVFSLSDRKWLTFVRSIYQIWQRDTVHLNWLSTLGMALSTCSNMKMNLTLSLQTHQILLVCIIIIIIIAIVGVVIPQFGSRKGHAYDKISIVQNCYKFCISCYSFYSQRTSSSLLSLVGVCLS